MCDIVLFQLRRLLVFTSCTILHICVFPDIKHGPLLFTGPQKYLIIIHKTISNTNVAMLAVFISCISMLLKFHFVKTHKKESLFTQHWKCCAVCSINQSRTLCPTGSDKINRSWSLTCVGQAVLVNCLLLISENLQRFWNVLNIWSSEGAGIRPPQWTALSTFNNLEQWKINLIWYR